VIQFDVVGVPVQQGSKRHVGGGRMIETGGVRLRDWRHAVATEARTVAAGIDDTPLDGPLCLAVRFRFPMPASRPKRLRDIGTGWKTSAPDLDKLVRSVGDSLTDSGLIRDDARIGMVIASKVETTGWSGATIQLYPLDAFKAGQ
jgi:Holliday junction resolvase RusA-like endonuclease